MIIIVINELLQFSKIPRDNNLSEWIFKNNKMDDHIGEVILLIFHPISDHVGNGL